MIVGDKVFKIPTSGQVAIDSVSWVRYNEDRNAVLICRDDSGTAGTWFGNCADANTTIITDWVSLESFMASSDFQPWAAQFTSVSESYDGITNGKIEVFITYR